MKDLLDTSLCVSILLAHLWPSIWLATLCLNFITRLFLKELNIVVASKRPVCCHLCLTRTDKTYPSYYRYVCGTIKVRLHRCPWYDSTRHSVALWFQNHPSVQVYYRSFVRLALAAAGAFLQLFGELLYVVLQFAADVFVLESEFNVGLDEALLVSNVIAFSVEQPTIHRLFRQHQLHRIGKLQFAALAGFYLCKAIEDVGREDISSGDGQGGGGFLGGWFFDKTVYLEDAWRDFVAADYSVSADSCPVDPVNED